MTLSDAQIATLITLAERMGGKPAWLYEDFLRFRFDTEHGAGAYDRHKAEARRAEGLVLPRLAATGEEPTP